MSTLPNPFGIGRSQSWEAGASNPAVIRFLNTVYAWMCAGLLLSGGVAWYVSQNVQILQSLGKGIWALVVVELLLVVAISGAINRINATTATLLFLLYAAINGVVLSGIFLIYAHSTLASAFLITAGTFGAMSLYGMVTRSDLSGLRQYLMMGLIGVVIASIVSFFWHSTVLQVAINYVAVLVFVGLTAYDTQRLKAIAYQTQGNAALASRLAISGALTLYLDFLNLFLFILELMGDRRK